MIRSRVVVACVVAPLAVPIGIFLLFNALHVLQIGWFPGTDYGLVLSGVFIWTVYGVPVALVVTLLGGIPCYLRLNRTGRRGVWPYLCRGPVLGAAPFLLFDFYIVAFELWRSLSHSIRDPFFGIAPTVRRLFDSAPTASAWAGIGAYCGCIGALLFWLVGVRSTMVERGAT